ncbi:MAG: LuxR C-terminal-related transcriptional regulator [Deinococcota bacterium]|nr:LuxR C-terminal-related transcriptional regulator [Deinococcota bacterium]
MSTTILATKLYLPPPRAKVVVRTHLLERLNQSLHRRLTLISAPAGFGKTTLVSEWVADCERPVAWLSLDKGDNDPTRFLTYLVAALQTVVPKLGAGVLAVLQSPQPPPAEAILTALLNEITAIADKFVLVLDDYHVVDSPPVDHALAFVLEHLPPQLHLVIATREDPPLPLARLRAQGHLSELRAADLRFTPSEAAEFLKGVMSLDLSADEVARLETRTEGWIAGLQLAALSMQGRRDTAAFIRAFTGSHRFVLDYLIEEVLQRQPERVRSFLLQTAVLDRLSAPLCDAVTGGGDSRGMLESFERTNLFVVPLDDERHWYRYHHLFAEVLQARLVVEKPDQLFNLHRRASAWYEQNGLPSAAIRHAFAAEDFARAAGLVELEALAMLMSRQEETFLGWLKALPDELLKTRPALSVYYALALVSVDLGAAEARLRDAERLLDGMSGPEAPSAQMVVVDEEGFRSLPGIAAITRAYHAGALSDVPGSVRYARRALDLLPEGDHLWRGAAAALLGLAQWSGGDLEAAYRTFADSVASLRLAGDLTQDISGAFILANIRTAQGRLHEAAGIYEQALQRAAGRGEPTAPGIADLYVGKSELCYEQNELKAASRHLQKSKELGERGGIAENRYRWYVVMARIKEAQGDLEDALEQLEEAERLYIRSPDPYVRPIAALKTRVWLRQGRVSEALEWAREAGLSSGDDLSYLLEFEHITLARALIAQYKSNRVDSWVHEAMSLLERLLSAAEGGGRTGSAIEILVLQALAFEAQGDTMRALEPLKRTLTLAGPEGYVRVFVDEGKPVAGLLQKLARKDNAPHVQAYVRKLLAALGPEDVARETPSRQPADIAGLLEPLSERELEVLRLVAQGLSNQEISRRLFRALSTVKGHNRIIFDKLGVKNRTEAVARARELGLLGLEHP